MSEYNPYQPPKITFTSIAQEKKMPLYLGLYTDDVLILEMKKAAETEQYDEAIVYRDELMRRGLLQ